MHSEAIREWLLSDSQPPPVQIQNEALDGVRIEFDQCADWPWAGSNPDRVVYRRIESCTCRAIKSPKAVRDVCTKIFR